MTDNVRNRKSSGNYPANTCPHCGWQHPVAVMIADHEQVCEQRLVQRGA